MRKMIQYDKSRLNGIKVSTWGKRVPDPPPILTTIRLRCLGVGGGRVGVGSVD